MVDNLERKAYHRAYYLAHKKEKSVRNKAYRLANKKEIAIKEKAYRLANKEKVATYLKAYKLAHKKEAVEYHKAYHLAHKKEIAERQRTYHQKYPEKGRAGERKYRALKYGNNHEPYTGNYVFERDNWVCQICGRKINRKLKYPNPRSGSIDHIVPLSKGGNDSPINVQATHLRCNVGKHATNKGQLRLFK